MLTPDNRIIKAPLHQRQRRHQRGHRLGRPPRLLGAVPPRALRRTGGPRVPLQRLPRPHRDALEERRRGRHRGHQRRLRPADREPSHPQEGAHPGLGRALHRSGRRVRLLGITGMVVR